MVLARRQRTTCRSWECCKPGTFPRQRGELNPCFPAWAIWRHGRIPVLAVALVITNVGQVWQVLPRGSCSHRRARARLQPLRERPRCQRHQDDVPLVVEVWDAPIRECRIPTHRVVCHEELVMILPRK